jgi:hypothetical protein
MRAVARAREATGAASRGISRRMAGGDVRARLATIAVERPFIARSVHLAGEHRAQRLSWRLGQQATDHLALGLLAAVLSVASYAWYASRGLTLVYGDAISHMMIARRVVAGRTPGLAQLGTSWLPLNHAFMVPLIWSDFLFRDGFAGAFPSMIAYVAGTIYTYRLGRLAFSSPLVGWLAALVFALNPNTLYMQSTAMSELDLMSLAIIAIFYTLRWSHDVNPADLVKAAAAAAAGTMVRYDGWALAVALAALVIYVSWRRRGLAHAESNALLFGVLAFAGCAFWLVYNEVIFGNALEFYNGPFTAKAQQQQIADRGGLPTLHNPLLSLHVYAQATLDNIGLPLALAALAGLLLWAFRARLATESLPLLALLVPLVFNWLSLVMGVSIIQTPEITWGGGPTYFNERYGMLMIPAAAIFLAFLVAKRRWLAGAAIALIVIFGVVGTVAQTPYVLQDPLRGSVRTLAPEAGDWLHSQYHGGNILLSYVPFAPTMFFANLPDNDFITDSNGVQFTRTLAHPEQWTAWIVMDQGNLSDPVWGALGKRQDWRAYYVLRHSIGTIAFYQRLDTTPPTSSSRPVLPTMAVVARRIALAARSD